MTSTGDELESRIRHHLRSKASMVDDPPHDPRTPTRLASSRDRRRIGVVLSAAVLTITIGLGGLAAFVRDDETITATATAQQPAEDLPSASIDPAGPAPDWQLVDLPDGLVPWHIEWTGSEFVMLGDTQTLWRSDEGRSWSEVEFEELAIDPIGMTASEDVIVMWGPAELTGPLLEKVEIVASGDRGQTWEVLGAIGSATEGRDPSPYVHGGESVRGVAISDDVIVVATGSGVTFDTERILVDRGLVDGPDDPRRGSITVAAGEGGVQIYLNDRPDGAADITISESELGMTAAEIAAISGHGSSSVYRVNLGETLGRVQVEGLDQIQSVAAGPGGFLLTTLSGNDAPFYRSVDGFEWTLIPGVDGFLEGFEILGDVVYATDWPRGVVRRSADGGETWTDVDEVADIAGHPSAGPAGLIVSGPPAGSTFGARVENQPDSVIAWTADLESWNRQSMAEVFGGNGVARFAIGARQILAITSPFEPLDNQQRQQLYIADLSG